VKTLTAQRRLPSGYVVLRDRELTTTTAEGTTRKALANPEELLDVLAATFDLAFPAGTRFRVPTFDDAGPPSG
ncbi:MAG TPA: hypothetical protein VGR00_01305, partial [Thermoanaerobaculia bacterium]|nr:hypothetical protein [Thermoanaerobaculia bacterium]